MDELKLPTEIVLDQHAARVDAKELEHAMQRLPRLSATGTERAA